MVRVIGSARYKSTNEAIPLIPNQDTEAILIAQNQGTEVDSNLNTNSESMSQETPNPTFKFILTGVIIIVLVNVLSQVAFVVQPGMIGLVVTLGNVVAVESGLHYKYPFISKVITFSAKTQKLEESNNTPTKEGLSVQLDTAM